MLFHSFPFVFVFLPITVVGFWVINRFFGREIALNWLLAASLFFYAQWSYTLVLLVGASIGFNYVAAKCILVARAQPAYARMLLLGAISANLAYLGYFKYANFFIENLNFALNTTFSPLEILLPVGISFYTFIQIGYLFDVYSGLVRNHRFGHYALFAGFFPYITAGPLVLQAEMLKQFTEPTPSKKISNFVAVGVAVFSAGLFKKVVFADSIGVFADAMFAAVAVGGVPTTSAAWLGSLAYTLQLYFDFSGYSDMALGIGILLGFRLPINFNSPLKARSIVDFWHRWHITMTRFFTAYVYSPIAIVLTRRSLRMDSAALVKFLIAIALPVVATFVLAGLWHGAGWTFVVFGFIHGLALAVNHGWNAAKLPSVFYPLDWLLTVLVVIVGLVFFRAESVADAFTVIGAMTALHSPATAFVLDNVVAALAWVSALGFLVLMFPNTLEIIQLKDIKFDGIAGNKTLPSLFIWRQSIIWAVVNAVILVVALGMFSRKTMFIYYQF